MKTVAIDTEHHYWFRKRRGMGEYPGYGLWNTGTKPPRICEPLFTTKPKESLGLAITRSASNKTTNYQVESHEGDGTYVTVRLPSDGREKNDDIERILIVDDDLLFSSVGANLKARGYDLLLPATEMKLSES
jgi:hypothetical protein